MHDIFILAVCPHWYVIHTRYWVSAGLQLLGDLWTFNLLLSPNVNHFQRDATIIVNDAAEKSAPSFESHPSIYDSYFFGYIAFDHEKIYEDCLHVLSNILIL